MRKALPVILAALVLGLGGGPAAWAEDACYQAAKGGDCEQTIRVCSEQLAAGGETPQSQASALTNRGVCWLAQGQIEQAMADFSQAIALAPGLAAAYSNRGGAWLKQGRPEQAVADFNQALIILPDNALLLFNRGYALLMGGQTAQALADFNRCLALMPGYVPAHYQRGLAWLRQGHPERAVEDFDRVLAKEKSSAAAYTQRGLAWERLSERQRALADLDQALALNPNEAQALGGRGLVYKKMGQYEQALTDYRRALELDPGQDGAANALAWLLATCPEDRLRNGQEALALARRALEVREDAGRLDTLAACLAETGQFPQAVEAQQKAIALILPASRNRVGPAYQERLQAYQAGRPWREKAPQP